LDGRKFRRQHSIGNYIVDFFCPAENLAIELDGAHHFTGLGQETDQLRDEYLNALEIKVLRFENKEIFEDMDQVLGRIKVAFRV
jgi:very-short-patch-repair endonuclease